MIGKRGARGWFLAFSLVVLSACAGSARPASESVLEEQPPPSGSERGGRDSAEAEESSEPSPSSAPGPRSFGYLEVPGFLPAPFAAPQAEGAPESSLRVFVLAHGAGGRGEHHCAFWEPQLKADVVLICPQGSLLNRAEPDGGAYYPDHLALGRELVALLAAIEEKWGEAVDEGSFRYIGYSQGATMGALAVVGELPVFTELVLIEGGGESWTPSRAHSFKESGGQRVLLACGTPGCAKRGEQSVLVLRQAGVEARHVHAPGGGHTYGGEVGRLALEGMRAWETEAGGAK